MRTYISKRNLKIARQQFSDGISRQIPNLTVSELCEGLASACSAIKSEHIIKSFPLTGYSEDTSKYSKELKYILANPPDFDKLPSLEKARKFDPTGLTTNPRKSDEDLKSPRQKKWTCTYCGWTAGFYYASFHDEARGGSCPAKSVKKTFKPMRMSRALFFSSNF